MSSLLKFVTQFPNQEELFLQRYPRLLSWALHLTAGDRAAAEDLVHDLFVQARLKRLNLHTLRDPDGYLFIMLKNLRLSQVRRAARTQTTSLSVADYETAQTALQSIDISAQVLARDELRQVCRYACQRKETSKAGSVLILRFFHGYYPGEISKIARTTRNEAEKRLHVARHEARLYLQDPQSLECTAQNQAGVGLVNSPGQTIAGDFLQELREIIFRSRRGDCLTDDQLERLYRSTGNGAVPSATLAHIVSCSQCLNKVNQILRLPPLSDRFPTDMLGPDSRSKEGPAGKAGAGDSADSVAKRYRQKLKSVLDHKPHELRIAANGFFIGALKVGHQRNELAWSINVDEKLGFLEVFGEEGVRLLLFGVTPPPEGAVEQFERVELSDGRSLELTLSFRTQWPELRVVYCDPALPASQAAGKENVAEAAGGTETLELPTLAPHGFTPSAIRWRRWRWLLRPGFWLRPGTATGILSIVLIVALLFRLLTPSVSAAELLQRSSLAEQAAVASPNLVLHRSLTLEERRAGDDALVARRRIEVWRGAAGAARRVFDEQGELIAGEWKKTDGSRRVYRQGAELKTQPAREPGGQLPLTFDDLWLLEPSAQDFTALIGHPEAASVEDQGTAYLIRYQAEEQELGAATPGLLKATITLQKVDLHAIEQVLVVRVGSEVREYRLTESSFEQYAPSTVAPSMFEPDPHLSRPKSRKSHKPKLALPVPAVASPELEIEVLHALSQVGADLGEQVEVNRASDGTLHVEGIVETDERKQEILQALGAARKHPAVRVELTSEAEVLERQAQAEASGPAVVYRTATAQEAIPAGQELRRYFSDEQGLPDEQIEAEVGRFAYRMLDRSKKSLQHAWALKRLVERFSAEELRKLEPEARRKWLAMMHRHALALEQATRQMRQELEPVFFPTALADNSKETIEIGGERELTGTVLHLLELSAAHRRVMHSAFALSPETAQDTSLRNSPLWRSLTAAAKFAAAVQTTCRKWEAGIGAAPEEQQVPSTRKPEIRDQGKPKGGKND